MKTNLRNGQVAGDQRWRWQGPETESASSLARDIVWLRFKPRYFPHRVPAMRTKSNGSQAARTPVSTWTKALLPATRGLPAPSTCLHPPPHICTAFQRIQPNSHRYIIIYIIRNAFRALIIHSVSRRRKKRTGTHCRRLIVRKLT